ncbi:hypothetical protein [Companilactobacillus sp. HBUAS56257]|jgi:hypothetical protein|uniref:hypothetical protein n=1 Tax=Companilactobacillus sp. HBUAS56257 TaxID=3109360 RepID=UPI002FF35D8E
MPKNRTGHGSIYGSPYAKGRDLTRRAVHERYEWEISKVLEKKKKRGRNSRVIDKSNYELLVRSLFKRRFAAVALSEFKFRNVRDIDVVATDADSHKKYRCKVDLKSNEIKLIGMIN